MQLLTDEGLREAAGAMRDAAQCNRLAAETFREAVYQLNVLIGQGYGNNLEQLLEVLKKAQGSSVIIKP